MAQKKLTRQEDQKYIFNFVWPNIIVLPMLFRENNSHELLFAPFAKFVALKKGTLQCSVLCPMPFHLYICNSKYKVTHKVQGHKEKLSKC